MPQMTGLTADGSTCDAVDSPVGAEQRTLDPLRGGSCLTANRCATEVRQPTYDMRTARPRSGPQASAVGAGLLQTSEELPLTKTSSVQWTRGRRSPLHTPERSVARTGPGRLAHSLSSHGGIILPCPARNADALPAGVPSGGGCC
jgi:hypothetical protein